VRDAQGRPLLGAQANSTSFSIQSQSYNSDDHLLVGVDEARTQGLVRISRTGYFPLLVHFEQIVEDESRIVVLKKQPDPIKVNGAIGGKFITREGASVDMPPRLLERPDGSIVDGEIDLFIHTVDISDQNERNAFPGSFAGQAIDDNEPGRLFSLGVTSVSFYENGQKLQLADGFAVPLTLPIYVTKHMDGTDIQLNDRIPMWILNEETGIWEEEGIGTVISEPRSPTGLALQAYTTHFSSFNTDVWSSPGPALNGPRGNPTAQPRSSSWCDVTARVPQLEPGTRFLVRFYQVWPSGPITTRSRTDVYFDGISFAVLQGRAALIEVTQPSYKNNEGRSTRMSFVCNSESTEIEVSFDGDPAFFDYGIRSEPVFEIVDGKNEIAYNLVYIGGGFVRDADNKVEVNSNHGYARTHSKDYIKELIYRADEPSPLNFASYLENDEGQADRLDQVEYIAQAAPIVNQAYAFHYKGTKTFVWLVQGADTVTLQDVASGIIIDTIDDTGDVHEYQTDLELQSGKYIMSFENQYGVTAVEAYLDVQFDCDPNSDLPCNSVPQ